MSDLEPKKRLTSMFRSYDEAVAYVEERYAAALGLSVRMMYNREAMVPHLPIGVEIPPVQEGAKVGLVLPDDYKEKEENNSPYTYVARLQFPVKGALGIEQRITVHQIPAFGVEVGGLKDIKVMDAGSFFDWSSSVVSQWWS